MEEIVGQIIGGSTEEVIIREKHDSKIELGELLIADDMLLMVTSVEYGSLFDEKNLMKLSGEYLDGVIGNIAETFFDKKIRFFNIVRAKCLLDLAKVDGKSVEPRLPKRLPRFLSDVRRVRSSDFDFIKFDSQRGLYVGKIRSGSRVLDKPIFLPIGQARLEDIISHHILVVATTGRGKSNFVKVMISSLLQNEECGLIILDPHGEYYGSENKKGIKDLPAARDYVIHFSKKSAPNSYTLWINLKSVRPQHLIEIGNFTEAQEQAMYLYYRRYKEDWISKIFTAPIENGVDPKTLEVLRRKIKRYVGIEYDEEKKSFISHSVFTTDKGEQVVGKICEYVEKGKKVIIDTSLLDSTSELLVAALIAENIFDRYKTHNEKDILKDKPVVGIVIEEAPRVLSESNDNVFCRIAREGRKFKIGLIAITQIVESIPYDILANMNTKIILGVEVKSEREKIISSCAHDLSAEKAGIASLEKGEAIISSIFTKFPIPVYIELFDEYIKNIKNKSEKL